MLLMFPNLNLLGLRFWVQSVGAGNSLVTTPPNNPQATNPYAYQLRLITPDVTNGTALEPPPAYSTDPGFTIFCNGKRCV